MKEYWIVCADSTNQLQELVNKALKDGWRAQGGVVYVPDGVFRWLQAMVR